MQSIKLSKVQGETYRPNTLKVYAVSRDGKSVGTLEQDFGGRWEIVNADFKRVSTHTTIKAAARVARRVL